MEIDENQKISVSTCKKCCTSGDRHSEIQHWKGLIESTGLLFQGYRHLVLNRQFTQTGTLFSRNNIAATNGDSWIYRNQNCFISVAKTNKAAHRRSSLYVFVMSCGYFFSDTILTEHFRHHPSKTLWWHDSTIPRNHGPYIFFHKYFHIPKDLGTLRMWCFHDSKEPDFKSFSSSSKPMHDGLPLPSSHLGVFFGARWWWKKPQISELYIVTYMHI